jgi:hypothetical protein
MPLSLWLQQSAGRLGSPPPTDPLPLPRTFPPSLPPRRQVYQEGTHLMVPWFDRPIIYDVRARPSLISSTSGSRDLQMVNIGLRVLTRPNPEKLPQLYR